MASAAILAGGQARRFGGADKGALLVDGRRIVDWQLQQLRQLTDDIIIVGGREDDGITGVHRTVDRVPGSGPLGGLDAAFEAARDESLIVLACDMPFITARFLDMLLSLVDPVDAVVPRTEHGYHPLCAVYQRSCHPTVIRHLMERRLKMKDLLEGLRVHVVERELITPYGDERLLANVNTPDELRELQAHPGHEL